MKHSSSKKLTLRLTVGLVPFLLLFSFLLFSSFTVNKFADDFLKQLGISKANADEKIMGSILGGSLDTYGLTNAKNIATGNRKAVALDLLAYTKKQVNSEAFIKQYRAIKENNKPKPSIAQTPEEMRSQTIAMARKGVADIEAMVKNADAANKPIFEKVLADAQKSLKALEDPNNKSFASYAKGYDNLVKDFKANNDAQLANWEKKYPTNHLLYVKVRLEEFMNETKDIDFGAELVTKNGKKYFVNRDYESKGNRWKMAFRAGKEVVEPSREFVQQWIDEIK